MRAALAIVKRKDNPFAADYGDFSAEVDSRLSDIRSLTNRRDSITVLEPWDELFNQPAGAHPGKTYKGPQYSKTSYKLGTYFNTQTISVGNLRDLIAVKCKVANDGYQFIVRGKPIRTGVERRWKCLGRTEDNLEDKPTFWVMLDMDRILNVLGMDPVTQPEEALKFLRSLLPYSIARRTLGYDWSSSSGLPGGATLDCHLWLWLDTALTEAELKHLYRRLNAFIQNGLLGHGEKFAPTKNFIDPKMAEVMQPHYVARPRFENGAKDPHPGSTRAGIIEGDGDEVILSELLAELEEYEADPKWHIYGVKVPASAKSTPKGERKPREKKTGEKKARAGKSKAATPEVARTPRPLNAPQPINIVPFQAARRLMEAQRLALGPVTTPRKKKERDLALFIRRAPIEIIEGVLRRVQAGAWDETWATWHDEKGIPEGERSKLFTVIASLIVEALPIHFTAEQARAQIAEVAPLVVSREWFETEWLRYSYDREIIDRHVRRSMGERVLWNGEDKAPTYGYSKAKIIEEFKFDEDEMVEMGWKSITTNAVRMRRKHEAQGMKSRDVYEAQAHAMDEQVWTLRDAGRSLRAIATELKISLGRVQRALDGRGEAKSQPTQEVDVAQTDVQVAQPQVEAGQPEIRIEALSRSLQDEFNELEEQIIRQREQQMFSPERVWQRIQNFLEIGMSDQQIGNYAGWSDDLKTTSLQPIPAWAVRKAIDIYAPDPTQKVWQRPAWVPKAA